MTELIKKPVEYRKLQEFPGYLIGNDGSVWSCRNRNKYGKLYSKYRKLKPSLLSNGYYRVSICRGGEKHDLSVHHLVLITFVGPKPESLTANFVARHLNGIRTDNRASNLVWGTYKENSADMEINGTRSRGTDRWSCKLSEEDVLKIRNELTNLTNAETAKLYGVTRQAIIRIRQRLCWKHLP